MVNLISEDKLEEETRRGLNLLGLKIHNFIKSHHPRRRADSFKYAFKGVFHALSNEPNFRIQLVVVLFSIFLGLFFEITTTEWGLLTLSSGLLLSAEMLNTVVEEFIDHLIKEESLAARIIKDLSAGFVLIMAFTTLIILFLIFGKYLKPFVFLD